MSAAGGLIISGLRKRYGAVDVVNGVDFVVTPGSVHALLGPNGAGKSTIIKCLNGAVHPDRGTIVLDGRPLEGLSPVLARRAGIATIHQNLSVVDSLSISDNLFLGRELTVGPWLRRRKQRELAGALLQQFGLDIDPDRTVGRLSSGHKQLVEIAKAMSSGEVKVLVLDEPTSSLSRDESEVLFREIERMCRRGICVIYVTHRLGEVFRVADMVTVIRNGIKTLKAPIAELTPAKLISAFSDAEARSYSPSHIGGEGEREAKLQVENYEGPRFGPLTFSAKSGEILGLYGSIGSGRTSLLETLAGRHQPSGGDVTLEAKPLHAGSIAAALRQGIAIVPSERNRQGLWPILSTSTNALMPMYVSLSKLGFRSRAAERSYYEGITHDLNVTPSGPDIAVSDLSGGNAQKILIGRWLANARRLNVLLLDEPTSGVDVEARGQIHSAIHAAADDGLTVLVSSSDAEELVQLVDRVLVFRDGQIAGEIAGSKITEASLLAAAHQFNIVASPSARGSTHTKANG